MTMTDRGVQTLNREGAKPGVSRAFIFIAGAQDHFSVARHVLLDSVRGGMVAMSTLMSQSMRADILRSALLKLPAAGGAGFEGLLARSK